ncbi:hypothetical protein [Luteolibacter marinus]|uniref:hypothetical protein n=1 Tax=Luteolibacter marinus TaxID=2776705 RepID=UPI001867EA79|nr:hypothetical protein [Luteolibacter marinus]
MKISFALAALILAVASVFGWKDHQSLSAARETHESLSREARALGLDPSAPAGEDDLSVVTKLTREGGGDRDAEAKAFAADLIAFAVEMDALEKSGKQPDEGMQKRILDMMERMGRLDVAQIKTLVAELRADTVLNDEMRRNLTGFAVMSLAENHPQAALALFTETSDLFEQNGMSQHVVSSALQKWAEDDPMGALEWVKANAAKHPEMINDQAKRSILTGAARQDPRLAFQLLEELDLGGGMVGNSIANAAATPSERTAVLAALRDHLKNVTDPQARENLLSSTLGTMCQQAISDGFEAGIAWLDSASFSPEETETFADGINLWQAREDTGKWINWLEGQVPQDQLARKVDNLMRDWTTNDYMAAGEWLNTAAEGPAKQTAVESYAKTLAPYEPAVAARWALTLPEGAVRDQLVREVHDQWKNKDEAAAAEFAEQQGLNE